MGSEAESATAGKIEIVVGKKTIAGNNARTTAEIAMTVPTVMVARVPDPLRIPSGGAIGVKERAKENVVNVLNATCQCGIRDRMLGIQTWRQKRLEGVLAYRAIPTTTI